MALDPAVEAQIETGQIAIRELVRFDLPGKTVGYHMGGRPYTYNGLTFLPNKFLQMGEFKGDLGIAVTAREIAFANVPSDDVNDVIATLESYAYTNAPVIITTLGGVPGSNDVLGVLVSSIYEINDVRYEEGAIGENGERSVTVIVELEPPGRSARGTTGVKRSKAEQQFDNSASDTSLRYVGVNASWPEEWGQRGG